MATSITTDVVAAGNTANGPATNSLTVPWSLNVGSGAGLALAAFKFNTNAPSSRSITRTVTHNGKVLTPIISRGIGWGLPSKGFVELWAIKTPDSGSHNTSVGLAYEQNVGDPWSAADATFSNFSGVSLSLDGANDWAVPHGFVGTTEHTAHGSGKMMSLGISAFQTSTTIAVLATEGTIDEESLEDNVLFLDSAKQLLVARIRGSGALKAQGSGGNWAAVSVNVLPV